MRHHGTATIPNRPDVPVFLLKIFSFLSMARRESHVEIDRLNTLLESPLDGRDRLIQGHVEVYTNPPLRRRLIDGTSSDESQSDEPDFKKRKLSDEPSEALTSYMAGILSEAFEDYDFSSASSSSFSTTTAAGAMRSLNLHTCGPLAAVLPQFSSQFWDALNVGLVVLVCSVVLGCVHIVYAASFVTTAVLCFCF